MYIYMSAYKYIYIHTEYEYIHIYGYVRYTLRCLKYIYMFFPLYGYNGLISLTPKICYF